jgi:hypothetical protein
MDALGIRVITESTAESYFAAARQSNVERKEVLRAKSIETIRAEMKEYKFSPVDEWSGDLPPNCWSDPGPTHVPVL